MHQHDHPHSDTQLFPENSILQDINPIILGSALQGSGENLIHKALGSAPNTLIYGASAANDLTMLTGLYTSRLLYFKQNPNHWNAGLAETLSEDQDTFFYDLMPEMEEYFQIMPDAYLSGFLHYKNFSAEKGRDIWGLCMGGWNAANFRTIAPMLPNTRFVYLVRDAIETMKAGKAIKLVQSLDDFSNVSGIWNQQVEAILQFKDNPRFLILKYEDIIRDPESHITKLEEFTGASGISKALVEKEIQAGHAMEELTEAEAEAVRNAAGPMREKMGYVMSRFL